MDDSLFRRWRHRHAVDMNDIRAGRDYITAKPMTAFYLEHGKHAGGENTHPDLKIKTGTKVSVTNVDKNFIYFVTGSMQSVKFDGRHLRTALNFFTTPGEFASAVTRKERATSTPQAPDAKVLPVYEIVEDTRAWASVGPGAKSMVLVPSTRVRVLEVFRLDHGGNPEMAKLQFVGEEQRYAEVYVRWGDFQYSAKPVGSDPAGTVPESGKVIGPPSRPSTTKVQDVKSVDPDAEFDRLIKLRDDGALTPEQFQEKSRRLFGFRRTWALRRLGAGVDPMDLDALAAGVHASYKRDLSMGLDPERALAHSMGNWSMSINMRRQMAGGQAMDDAELADLRGRVQRLIAQGQDQIIAHAMPIMTRTAKDAARDYSCVMVNVKDKDFAKVFSQIVASIPDEDIYDPPDDDKFGREDKPHVTIKYGLHTGDADDVRHLIEGFGPIEIEIAGVSFFRADGKDYDVLKFDIESDDLRKLRSLIEKELPATDEHPEYHPHMTIAYLARGKAEDYADDKVFADMAKSKLSGQKIVIESVCFSDKGSGKTEISAVGKKVEAAVAGGFRLRSIMPMNVWYSPEADPLAMAPGAFIEVTSLEGQIASIRFMQNGEKISYYGTINADELDRKTIPWRAERTSGDHLARKKPTPAQEKENEAISENKKKPEASKPHDFKPAKWTHPNGHPRCLVCGHEEIIGGRCNVTPTAKDYAEFEAELDAEFPGRKERRERAEAALHDRFTRGEVTQTEMAQRLAGYRDWSRSFLFDPAKNPIPFPRPGQVSGLWGSVYSGQQNIAGKTGDDLDELWFLVQSDGDLYNRAQREFAAKNPEVADEGLIALMPVREHPEVIPFLKSAFDQINRQHVYPSWGVQEPEPGHEDDPFYQNSSSWKNQARDVVRILRGVYGEEHGAAQLEKFLSRLNPGEREDFLEEAARDPFSDMLQGLDDMVRKQKGQPPRTKPSPKTEMTLESVPGPTLTPGDIEARRDALLERFSLGEITQEQMEAEMAKLDRMASGGGREVLA